MGLALQRRGQLGSVGRRRCGGAVQLSHDYTPGASRVPCVGWWICRARWTALRGWRTGAWITLGVTHNPTAPATMKGCYFW